MGLWPRFELLLLALGLAGLGSALFHASGASLVGEFAPKERRGFWLSFFGSAGYLGLSLGPWWPSSPWGLWGLRGSSGLPPWPFFPPWPSSAFPRCGAGGSPPG